MSKRKRLDKEKKREKEISNLTVITVIVLLFGIGFAIKAIFFSNDISLRSSGMSQTAYRMATPVEEEVNLISKNFRCACGGCGEMQLIECECDMPRGAQEEKQFMRLKLREGLSVEEIIRLVDKKYGYRNI